MSFDVYRVWQGSNDITGGSKIWGAKAQRDILALLKSLAYAKILCICMIKVASWLVNMASSFASIISYVSVSVYDKYKICNMCIYDLAT